MILKGSQRAGGADLAVHLMRTDDNEHIDLHELRGFVSADLQGAFKEAEAISRATRCKQYLFSLSLNPPSDARLSVDEFRSAIEAVEARLGLEGQPRAIVFHEKEGRRHAHCVWSRIDADTLTARPLPFFKSRLQSVSRDLYLTHGWTMPDGLERAGARNPTNFTLAEWQQSKRSGLDPRLLKASVQSCWARADGIKALSNALEERGLFLAKGDRRDFVVLTHEGEVHALPRLLGLKTKEVRARLAGGEDALKSVAETKALIGAKLTPAIRTHIDAARDRFKPRADKLEAMRREMTDHHRAARKALATRQTLEWQAETKERADRLPKGLIGLWHRLTGKYQQIKHQNEQEAALTQARHAGERQALIDAQRSQRAVLQSRIADLRKDQARVLIDLRRDLGLFTRLSQPLGRTGPRR